VNPKPQEVENDVPEPVTIEGEMKEALAIVRLVRRRIDRCPRLISALKTMINEAIDEELA
jgi:hypothetical protein